MSRARYWCMAIACAIAPAPAACSRDAGHPAHPAHPASHPALAGHGDRADHADHRFEDPGTWSKRWDDPSRGAWQRPEEVIRLMRIAPGMAAVDLGAGTGYFVPYLAAAVGAAGKVFALDVEPEMVRWVAERMAREGLANVEARLVAPDDPGLAAGSIDRILVVNTWHHIGARVAYARKLAAALRPGGEVWIVDYTKESEKGPPRDEKLDERAVGAELRAAGLADGVATETLPEQYVVFGRRP